MSVIEENNFIGRGDVATMLPEPAAGKLRALRQAADDAHAVLAPVLEAIQNLSPERLTAQTRMRHLVGPRGGGGYDLGADQIQVKQVQATLDKLDAEATWLAELRDARSHRWNQTAGLVGAIKQWVREGIPRGTFIVPVEAEPLTLKKGEAVHDAIEHRRHRIRELDADRHSVESAPMPSSVGKAKIRSQIAALAASGEPALEATVAFGDDAEFPTQSIRSQVHGKDGLYLGFAQTPDALGLIAWLFPDQLTAALDRLIEEIADDKNAIDDVTRAQRLAEIAGDRLLAEREEEQLILIAEAAGHSVLRRPDADPRAVLQIALEVETRTASPSIVSTILQKVVG